MAALQKGQVYRGLRDSYRIIDLAHPRTTNVWIASIEKKRDTPRQEASSGGQGPQRVVVKTARDLLLRNETHNLNILQGHRCIRQLIDRIETPASIVLEYVQDDLRSLSIRQKPQSLEIKNIAYQILEALSYIHSKGMVHTDLKPQNILISGIGPDNTCPQAFVKVADFANACTPADFKITPKSFRSPEVWLELPWGTPTDIWSFGAIIGSLLMGPYGELFGSSAKNEDEVDVEMLQKQNSMTGPYPPALLARAGGDWPELFNLFNRTLAEQEPRLSWRFVMKELQIAEEDGSFIERVLKIDPDQRPTADMLLQDPWFK